MRHFHISLFIFTAIISTAFASFVFTSSEIKQINVSVQELCDKQEISENDIMTVKAIKKRFNDKKNMLRFFINKEHINQLESNIMLLENYAINSDAENIREKSIETIIILNQINEYSAAVD